MTIEDWNSLPTELKTCQSLSSFKRLLKRNNESPYILYATENTRKSGIIHSRLHNRCSMLNSELFRVNLRDDPSCQCGAPHENSKHFLLECLLYAAQRTSVLDLINPLTNSVVNLKLLLYGATNLKLETNILIFDYVQQFINSSKRFCHNTS